VSSAIQIVTSVVAAFSVNYIMFIVFRSQFNNQLESNLSFSTALWQAHWAAYIKFCTPLPKNMFF
jgi:hypothetical protein